MVITVNHLHELESALRVESDNVNSGRLLALPTDVRLGWKW